MDGSIEPYQNTTEGAVIFFRCNPEFVPAGRMTAVCRADGRWNPDPATLVCTCEYHLKNYIIYSLWQSVLSSSHQVTVSLSVTAKYLGTLVVSGSLIDDWDKYIYSTYRLSGGD